MNKRLIAALLLMAALIFAVLTIMPEPEKPVALSDKARQFSLPDLKGELHGLPAGKVILLNFWATWCPPCRKEIPSMIKLYDKLKNRGFEIVAISVDRNPEDLISFVAEQQMNFTVLHDIDSTVARQYGVFRYPETLIIDRNGIVRQHLNGAVEWMEPEFFNYIEKLLAEPVAKPQSKALVE